MRQMRWIGVVGDADELRSCDVGRGLGATNGNKIFVLSRTKKNEKIRFKLCLDG